MQTCSRNCSDSGHLRVLKNLSVIKRCPLLRVGLKKIVIFGPKRFVRYSRHVCYLGCPLLRVFTVFIVVRYFLFNFINFGVMVFLNKITVINSRNCINVFNRFIIPSLFNNFFFYYTTKLI